MIGAMPRVQTPSSRLDVVGRLGSIGGLAVAVVMIVSAAGCQPKATAAPGEGAAPAHPDDGDIGAPGGALDDGGGDESGGEDGVAQDGVGEDGVGEDGVGEEAVEPGAPNLAAVDSVAGVPTQVISFDESDPNPGPTERVESQPGRPKSGSMLTPGVLAGPK